MKAWLIGDLAGYASRPGMHWGPACPVGPGCTGARHALGPGMHWGPACTVGPRRPVVIRCPHIMSTWQEYNSVAAPKVGLLFLGRLRGGFDPEWGAEVRRAVTARMDALSTETVIPSDNIATDQALADAIASCSAEGCSVLVVCQTTISDGRLAPVLMREWQAPVVLWATPEKPTGAMISANSLVGTHVFAATMRQLGHPFEFVYGSPDDEATVYRLTGAIGEVYAAVRISRAKAGLIGSHAPGFVDFHADPVSLRSQLGVSLHHHSVPELMNRVTGDDDSEAISHERAAFESLGLPDHSGAENPLDMQARYYRAFTGFMSEENLDVLAFRCWPDLPSNLGHWPYFALARLVSEGVPIAMEGDVDGALGSLIAESMAAGPVYLSDWLAHSAERAVIWHTGAAPFELCDPVGSETGPRLGVQFNNRLPTVVDANIRSGIEATLFRLWRCDGRYHLTALEGETAEPQQERMATNGEFVSSGADIRQWFEERIHEGMPHHVCVVPGHIADRLRRFARLLGIEWH